MSNLTKKQRKKNQRDMVGRTLQTRDEYIEGAKNYRKPGYENKGLYRKAVVVDEYSGKLAIVKLTKGSPKGIRLIDEIISKYRPYVYTKDELGHSIRINGKFRLNKANKSLSSRDIIKIKKDCFTGKSKRVKINSDKVRELKGRKKRK